MNTSEKLQKAKKLENLIEKQKNILERFTMGKISKISIRQFNNTNCTFEEEDFGENIPRNILKTAMIDFLKKDIEHLENKLTKLFAGPN